MSARMLIVGLLFAVAGGCTLTRAVTPLPATHSLVREQLVLYSDFDLPQHHRLLDELVAQRGDLTKTLNLPTSDEPIHVYLFNTPSNYQAYIRKHYPDFPERRAFFVESDTRLAVYAQWGERIAEDLRHEVAHGYLHAVVPNLPLWLDEGLAEYFEVPRGRDGLNDPHVKLLVQRREASQWSPDMLRLEQLASAADMTQLDYAESWAWVHWLLETTPERRELLQNHLARLRTTGSSVPLSDELKKAEPEAANLLIAHLKELEKNQSH
jgi:hypothetical protein